MKNLYEKLKVVDIDEDELIELYAMEGDTARVINFQFKNKINYIDLTGCRVRINANTSNYNVIYNELTIVDAKRGIAQLKLTTALLNPGTTKYQLEITGPTGELKPKIMRLIVAPRLNNYGAIEGSNEFTAFKEALKTMDQYDEKLVEFQETLNSEKEKIDKSLINLNNTAIKKTNKLDNCDLAPKKLIDFDTGVQADLMFYVDDSRNQQGLTYSLDHFYVGFDVGSNQGDIVKYTKSGVKVDSTGSIGIGHAAGLGFRESNGKIYVANGGGSNPTHVYEVDFNSKRVTRDINLEKYGTSALLAIDNDNDRLILHTSMGGDNGEIIFNILDFNGNSLAPQFKIANQGVPQGLEYYNGIMYYYTNDKITCINIESHEILGHFSVKKAGESEGITLVKDGATPYLAVGYNGSNRIYSIRTNEAQQFSTPSMLNLMYRNSDPSKCLVPKILAFTIKQLDSDPSNNKWIFENWNNGSGQSVKSLFEGEPVTQTDNDQINLTLKIPFYSVASFFGIPDWDLVREGISVCFDINGDGRTIRIAFRRNNTWLKLNELPRNADVRCLIIGGVDINY